MSNLMVAGEILNQLGGNKFLVMTGAKNLTGTPDSLSFRLPSTRDFVRDGINGVRITLEANDTYTVTFFKIRGVNLKTVAVVDGVYNDMLRDIFTRYTGLETSMGNLWFAR